MKIHGFLQPFMHSLFQGNPDITTAEAVAEIRDFLARQEDGDQHVDEAADIGFASVWGNFTGGLRRKAQERLKDATAAVKPSGEITIQVFENMKLPLADGNLSPTYADSTALMLRQSVRFMKSQVRGLERQLTLAEQLAGLLDAAAYAAGEPDLTVRDAFARNLLDWSSLSDQQATA